MTVDWTMEDCWECGVHEATGACYECGTPICDMCLYADGLCGHCFELVLEAAEEEDVDRCWDEYDYTDDGEGEGLT